MGAAVFDEHVVFFETVGVEEDLDALAGGEFAFGGFGRRLGGRDRACVLVR
jgi:hypothetical protein